MTNLFESPGFYAREITAANVPRVQTLYEENPDYFLAVHGRGPKKDAAQHEFDQLPPAHLTFTTRWFAGLFDRSHTLQGVVVVVSDLVAPGVWHIAFFLVATALHGTGAAAEIYLALEAWAARSGARWLRLGVVQGHTRPERFWQRRGFEEVRVRTGIDHGGSTKPVRVLVKPLAEAGLAEYLEAVPRDQPNSPLP
jgi:GNAT superfamily N-acetyltransferase